jgi:hypothetical protein
VLSCAYRIAILTAVLFHHFGRTHMGLGTLFKAGISLIDSGRDARVQAAAEEIERHLIADRDDFLLDRCIPHLELYREDVPLAVEACYRRFLKRAWSDRDVTARERRALAWVADRLKIPAATVEKLESDACLAAVRAVIAAEGLNGDRIEDLRRMLAVAGLEIGPVVRSYFHHDATRLLEALFVQSVEDHVITQEEWDGLKRTVATLGLSWDEFLAIVQPHAEPFVEHLLAEARADDDISADEKRWIEWALDRVITRPAFQRYVRGEIADVELRSQVARGILPSIGGAYVGLRAGEIVHAETPATYCRPRATQAGTTYQDTPGTITLTDDRLIFTGDSRSHEVGHRRVIGIAQYNDGFGLNSSARGGGLYSIGGFGARIFVLLYRVAVRKANQTIVAEGLTDGRPSRHIPRDVRQRVWQSYGGRCAECAATEYLEFDHIIPHARGGTNDERNVQLLCRGCNGTKSDAI